MDVTSTARSPVLTGIQRVMRHLSRAMGEIDPAWPHKLVLSYADDHTGWYGIDRADAWSITHDPRLRLGFDEGDVHFLLDSSWDYPQFQILRLREALLAGQPVIHGVHDLGPLTMPAMTAPGMPDCFARWLTFVLGHSTGIICVSRAVADEVFELIEAIELPRPMDVGYLQLGSDFIVTAGVETDWLELPNEYPLFLMVGTIEPRKGHALVIDAFSQLWAQGIKANLLIIGKPGWNTRILQERLAHHPQADQMLFVRSNISDAQLHGAYERATALIMASYLEGFGLPVVEAGKLGCPVILSDLPVFREVGQAARQTWFFPSGNARELARILTVVLGTAQPAHHIASAMSWPDWRATAHQVHDQVFGGNWYKRYTPEQIAPNAFPRNIGKLTMREPLTEFDRRHELRWINGPTVSEDGGEIQFTIGMRNLSSKLWTSQGRDGSSACAVALGSHLLDQNGECLAYDNPRALIPFALLPGKELLLPVRVSTDWLARGAHTVEVEVVQEHVTWFGEAVPFSLFQPPMSMVAATSSMEGSPGLGAVHLFVLRDAFAVPDMDGRFVLLGAINTTPTRIELSEGELSAQIRLITDSVESHDESGYTVRGFSQLDSGSCGLILLHLQAPRFHKANLLRVATPDPGEPGTWRRSMPDIWIGQ